MRKLLLIVVAVFLMSCVKPSAASYKYEVGQTVKSILVNGPTMIIDQRVVNYGGKRAYICHYFDLSQKYQQIMCIESELIER